MNTRTALLLLPLFAIACSGSDDDGTTDVIEPPRDGGTQTSIRDGGVPDDGCPALGAPLTGTEVAPLRRGDMAAAYDDRCAIVYMAFGDKAEPEACGFAGSDFIDDLHAFDVDAGTWHVLSSVSNEAPLQRARSQATWDRGSGRFILFGGRWRQAGSTGQYTFLNDVWAFDPVMRTWTELSPQVGGLLNDPAPVGKPKGRMNFSMVADPNGSTILIHGGGQTDFAAFQPDAQTWLFDVATTTWTLIPVSAEPPARLFHSAAYDAQRSRLYVFAGAGEDAFESFGDGNLWYLDVDNLTWHEVDQGALAFMDYGTNRPRPRIKGGMIDDPARDRILLFGGHDDLDLGNNNDLWAFDLETQTWSLVEVGDTPGRTGALGPCEFYGNFAVANPAVPERRESHLFVRAGQDRAVLYGGRTDCGLANDTWILDLTTDTWSQVTVSPTGMTCVRNGNPNCDDDNARMCD